MCVRVSKKCAHDGGDSNAASWTGRQFKLLAGTGDRASMDCKCFVGSHVVFDHHFYFHVQAHVQIYMYKLDKSKTMHILSRYFACTKWAQGTSGYWILTMKLQRLHSNGGDEVRSWDGNHKLILLTWQAARPWLQPNTALSSFTKVRKTHREENTLFIINFGSKEGHSRHRTHTYAWHFFDVTIVWDNNHVTFMHGYLKGLLLKWS